MKKGGRHTRTESNFFVRSAGTGACYCGKCGKKQYDDDYNRRKHAELCGFTAGAEGYPLKEGTDLGYSLEGSEKGVLFRICRPKLREIRGFSDRFYGMFWDPVFEAEFTAGSRNPKIVKNELELEISVLLSLIRAGRIVPIRPEKDIEEIRKAFPGVIDVYTLQMFDHIYRNKGYSSGRFLPERTERGLLNKLPEESAWEGLSDSCGEKIPILGFLYRYCGEHYILQLVLNEDGEKTVFLFSKGYCACSRDVSLKQVLRKEYYLAGKARAAILQFGKIYPEYLLEQYLQRSQNILFPLVAADYHTGIELAAKSGVPSIAENYEQFTVMDQAPALYSNLKKMFGLPLSVLRALTREQATEAVLERMKEINAYNPAFLQFEGYTASMIEFYMRANLTRVNRTNGIEGSEHFTAKQVRQILRYLGKHPDEGHYYCDYLIACARLREYPYGLTPDIPIRLAHDRTVARIRHNFDIDQQAAFEYEVSRPGYKALTTCLTEEDEETFKEDPFFVTAPERSQDLFAESESMHNCVRIYTPRVARGAVRIYFLRRKKEPDKSFGTLEVSEDGKYLYQAKAFANEKLKLNAQRFVVKWCRVKGIRINTWDIINQARLR